MMKAASLTIGLVVLCGSVAVRAQNSPTEAAIKEAAQRQYDTMLLQQKIGEARAAEARKDLVTAGKLYDQAYALVETTGNTGAERDATVAGLVAVNMELARSAQRVSNYIEADKRVTRVLKVDPQNAAAIAFKKENDRLMAAARGTTPSPEVVEKVPAIQNEKVDAQTHVRNGQLYYEMDKLDDAERELIEAQKIDPQNRGAMYYLNLVKEKRYSQAVQRREYSSRGELVEVEKEWTPPNKREFLPVPNPYATNKLIHVGPGRQAIVQKLETIKLDTVKYEGLPLDAVVVDLSEQAKKRDPLHRGVNFLLNSAPVAAPAPVATTIDPTTGLPIAAPPIEQIEIGTVPIKINPAMTDMRLSDVLEIVCRVSPTPIKYSIEEWGVEFSLRAPEAATLISRRFKVDPNTFYQGLESVGSYPVGDIQTGSSGGGGGGGGNRGGGGGQGGQGSSVIGVPRVNVAGGDFGGNQQGGGGNNNAGSGILAVTRTNSMEAVSAAVRQYFITVGVNLDPLLGKTVVFNDRAGELYVRATAQELDIIQDAIEMLNIVPHQISIKAKFAEITQTDTRALGFDWYLGNFLMNGGRIGGQAGTAPSFNGVPTQGNPGGTFPGTIIQDAAGNIVTDTTLAPSTSDGLLTGGLRNLANAPALGTLTGILTDPQFRLVVRAMEQRDGVDLLNAPEVLTPSGRQAQIQIVDIQTIVTGTSLNQNSGGGGNTLTGNNGGGVVGTTIDYPTEPVPFGTTLDVIPYISSDGYTIQMTIIPTITEFVGYDDPGKFIPQGQSVSSGNSGVALPITAQLPLPRIRLRQVTTSAIVWDGQTVVLGGLISEDVTRLKDKVPVLGDLPLVGKLFRSESSQTRKKNLVIFVTPTIIDPAGNRLHVDGEMPFDVNTIPPGQRPAFDSGAPVEINAR